MSNKNYFLDPARAAHYHKVRPSFHREALAEYHNRVPEILYNRVLDVGCGTGQSSVALTLWANEVVAIDNSSGMLNHAEAHPKIHYEKADAENLPFENESFDLVLVASSLHWFERRKFFNQVSRVLKSGGKFLVYDSYLTDGLKADFHKDFNARFPRPFSDVPIMEKELEFFNLKFEDLLKFNFDATFSEEDVVNYLYTLSNISAALEKGEKPEDVQRDILSLIRTHSTNDPYKFQVLLTEISRH